LAEQLKIVGLCGSLREGSHALSALRIAAAAAERAGAQVVIFDPREKPLPFCEGPSTPETHANAEEWRRLTAWADGFLLSTPEYHGSFSGVIKNALDLVGFEQLDGKVCGLVSVLGGGANNNALNHLRTVLRWVHAWVIPHQAAIGAAYGAFGADGTLKDAKLQARVERVGTDLAKYTRVLRAEARGE
jgi:NAD(P)H-dependent FMN reductase